MKKYLHPLLASLLVLGLVFNMLFTAPAQGLAEQWTAAGGVKQISAGWGSHLCLS